MCGNWSVLIEIVCCQSQEKKCLISINRPAQFVKPWWSSSQVQGRDHSIKSGWQILWPSMLSSLLGADEWWLHHVWPHMSDQFSRWTTRNSRFLFLLCLCACMCMCVSAGKNVCSQIPCERFTCASFNDILRTKQRKERRYETSNWSWCGKNSFVNVPPKYKL